MKFRLYNLYRVVHLSIHFPQYFSSGSWEIPTSPYFTDIICKPFDREINSATEINFSSLLLSRFNHFQPSLFIQLYYNSNCKEFKLSGVLLLQTTHSKFHFSSKLPQPAKFWKWRNSSGNTVNPCQRDEQFITRLGKSSDRTVIMLWSGVARSDFA